MVFFRTTLWPLSHGNHHEKTLAERETRRPGFISPVQWLQVEAPEDQIPRFFWDEHIDTVYIYGTIY